MTQFPRKPIKHQTCNGKRSATAPANEGADLGIYPFEHIGTIINRVAAQILEGKEKKSGRFSGHFNGERP